MTKSAIQNLIMMLFAALVVGASSCSSGNRTAGKSIVVSAAVSLQDAFLEIAPIYKARTGTTVHFSFGASGELAKQIEAGAPVDVFASAGEKEMDQIQLQSLVEPGTRSDFAGNMLVLVVPANSRLKLNSFNQLGEPQIRRVSIGNPKTVPAGIYAQQALESLHLWTELHDRLIFAEDVRQVLDYVMRGEVDAGIVYATDVAIARGKVRQAAEAPAGTYGPVRYPIAVIKGCAHPEEARQFVKLVLSREGQDILKSYGFQAINAQ